MIGRVCPPTLPVQSKHAPTHRQTQPICWSTTPAPTAVGYVIYETTPPSAGLTPRQASAHALVMRGHWIVSSAGLARHSGHFWAEELVHWIKTAPDNASHNNARGRTQVVLAIPLVKSLLKQAGYMLGDAQSPWDLSRASVGVSPTATMQLPRQKVLFSCLSSSASTFRCPNTRQMVADSDLSACP